MNLTTDQFLAQTIAAHKASKLQSAEQLYRSILNVQLSHPHANHNLGMLVVNVGKPKEALELFKTAFEANKKRGNSGLVISMH